jgi:hypothetical protein
MACRHRIRRERRMVVVVGIAYVATIVAGVVMLVIRLAH